MKLCHRNKSTIDRHITRRHKGTSKIIVKPYCETTETVKKAREYIENQPAYGTFNSKLQSKTPGASSSSEEEASSPTVNGPPVSAITKTTLKLVMLPFPHFSMALT